MEFENTAQERCHKAVGDMLREIYGEQVMFHKERPAYAIKQGSVLVSISVRAWLEDALVHIYCWVVTGTEPTRDFLAYLLRQNSSMTFGYFSLDEDNDVFMEHTLVGSTLDRPELQHAVRAVALLADRFDDEIVAKWGGARALDRNAS